MKSFKEFFNEPRDDVLDEVYVLGADGTEGEKLFEGKWIDGRFSRNIRIDQLTHLQRAV